MAVGNGGSRDTAERPQRTRLLPPRPGEIERRTRGARDAQHWTRGLRATQRRRLLMLLGNLLLLSVLVGLPFARGYQRAQATQRAHAAFLGCLYGARVTGGLGELAGEADSFAARLASLRPGWPAHCTDALDAVAAEPAFFVLPSVKAAEARVREAVEFVRGELAALAAYEPGERMPDRPVRALALLRSTIRKQVVQAGLNDEQVDLPARLVNGSRLAAPARLPLYAAADATLSVWGDDQLLRIVALDATGVSYLEVQPGQPFSRARLVRPSLLRAFSRFDDQGWLVWATAPARCAERSDACFGKTMRIAQTPSALLELPPARSLATHLAGRADRSLAPNAAGFVLAARAETGRVVVQEFSLPADFSTAKELPALSPRKTWPSVVDEAVVLSSADEALVLGLRREGGRSELVQMSASALRPLAMLKSGQPTWLTACATDTRVAFAFGDGQRVQLGALARTSEGFATQLFPEAPLTISMVIDPEHAQRDRARSVCTTGGVLLVAREAGDQLTATVCQPGRPCQKLSLAAEVEHFSVLATEHGALVAYAGATTAQVRVRSIDLMQSTLGPERVPAACWSKSGLCARPTLARVGSRIMLFAPEKTDLVALESADEGESFSTPPVL